MRRTWCNQIMLSNGQYKTVEFDWKILSICFHLASLSYDLCCALTSADQTIMTRTPSQQNFVCRPKSKLEISILGVKYFRCCGILAYRFSEDQLAADTSYLSHNTHTHTQRTVAGLFPSNKPIISVIIRFAMIHTVLSVCFFLSIGNDFWKTLLFWFVWLNLMNVISKRGTYLFRTHTFS